METRSHGKAIVVVEDLGAFRSLVVRVLRSEGYQVAGIGNAPGAIALCAEEHPDLLICDHTVPGGDGTEIARRALAANPGLEVIFMSGRPESSLNLDVPGCAPAAFLQKPFDIDVLVDHVRRLLGARQG
jgi:CheY-like chemotaxis protein